MKANSVKVKHLWLEHRQPKHVRVWTREEVQKLRELATQGCSVVDIARQLGRTMHAVTGRASKHGITLRSAWRSNRVRRTSAS